MSALQIEQHPSPNFGPRRDNARPSLIVLHYTAMQSAESACQTLCNPENEVSAHYLIGRDGKVQQLVAEDQRAWHAGAGQWAGITDVNSHSIGLELDNDGFSPFSAPLMNALEDLLPQIMQRWDISPTGVIAHSDLAPHRKIDPGPRFDWRRLALQGLAVWPDEQVKIAADDLSWWKDFAETFGYPIFGNFGEDVDVERACLEAFRSRFRPWVKGPLCLDDLHAIARLARQKIGNIS